VVGRQGYAIRPGVFVDTFTTLGVPVIHDKAMSKACMNAYIECVRYRLNHLPETEVTGEHMAAYNDV